MTDKSPAPSFTSNPGQYQTITDFLSADESNPADLAYIIAEYAHGDRELALVMIRAAKANQAANSSYHEVLTRAGLFGPRNPFFDGMSGANRSLGYQEAAGVPRTQLNPGLSDEKAKAIYDANPDGPPTDMS